MKKIILYLALAALFSAPAHALNKCVTPDGKTAYTDAPCQNSATKTEIKTAAPPPYIPGDKPAEISEKNKVEGMAAERHKRDIRHDLDDIDFEILTYRRQMEREMAALQNSKGASYNNLAGAMRDQGISTQMQAVASSYDAKIKIAQDRAAALRAELAAVGK